MNRKLLLIGDGGHCRSVYDSIQTMNIYEEIGIVVRDADDIKKMSSLSVVGCDDDLPELFRNGWNDACITLGSIGNVDSRKRLYHMVKKIGFSLPLIKDPTAILAKDIQIGEGVFIGKGVVVNSGVIIGDLSIINTRAVIEHDCKIGTFAHISPGSVLCGGVQIGEETHIGAGTVVRQMLSIGEKTVIGIGSVVVQDIPAHVTAYGNPCRVIRK